MKMGFMSRTDEFKWPVVVVGEPKHIRTIRGYIVILVRRTEDADTAEASYRVLYLDDESRPVQGLTVRDIDIFYDAAQAALVEVGLSVRLDDRPLVGDIIR